MSEAWPGEVIADSPDQLEAPGGAAWPGAEPAAEKAPQSDPLDYLDGEQRAIYDRLSPEQQKAWSEYKLEVPGLGMPALSVDVTAPSEPVPVLDEDPARRFHMGVGDVAQAVGDVAGLVANPVNAALNWTGIPQALTGEELGTDLGASFRDLTGAPDPVTDSEMLASSVNRGGTGAIATAGLALPLTAARGVTGSAARVIAENPIRDLIAGMAGGAGMEVGEDIGGTPGAIIGGVGGAIAGAKGAAYAERVAEEVVKRFPREVLVDSAGDLTDEAREIAARTGASADGIRRFARRRESDGPIPRRDSQARREARRQARSEAPFRPDEPVPPGAGRPAAGADPITESGGAPGRPREVWADAQEQGIPLTRGQAEQDFDVQNDENSLRVSGTREGAAARAWFQQQAERIKEASARFQQAITGPDAGEAATRGQRLKDAIQALRDDGAEGVRQLYREAEALGGGGLPLPTQGIRDAATDVLIDEAVPEGIKRAVSQELARYGIIGTAEPTNEVGLTRVLLDDGSSIQFRGPVKELTAGNAEDLRQAINRLYDPSRPNLSGQSIKPAIDDALEEALTSAAGQEGGIGAAYARARDAYRAQQGTFKAKDVIESLIATKKGTQTEAVLPERAIAQVLGSGPEGLTNLRRVRNLLMSRPSPSSTQAWNAIKQQALADIFEQALVRNTNTGGEIVETISGAKLRTAIFDRFGAKKLQELLDPQEFSQLMKLQRVIGAATIPMTGTTNPSGTFTKLVNYLRAGVLRAAAPIPGVNMAVDATGNLLAKAKELSATRKTLEGITNYRGPDSSRAMDEKARAFIREYIETGRSGRLMPATVSFSASGSSGS